MPASALNSRLRSSTSKLYNFQLEKEQVAQYRIDKVPATVLEAAKDYGIRFYGIPKGYGIVTLIDSLQRVSQGRSGLSAESAEKLESLKSPLLLEVFVTPTCPCCPAAARLAHQLAIEIDLPPEYVCAGAFASGIAFRAAAHGKSGLPGAPYSSRSGI